MVLRPGLGQGPILLVDPAVPGPSARHAQAPAPLELQARKGVDKSHELQIASRMLKTQAANGDYIEDLCMSEKVQMRQTWGTPSGHRFSGESWLTHA